MEYLQYRVQLRITTDNSHDAFGIAFYLFCVLPGYQADMKQQQNERQLCNVAACYVLRQNR